MCSDVGTEYDNIKNENKIIPSNNEENVHTRTLTEWNECAIAPTSNRGKHTRLDFYGKIIRENWVSLNENYLLMI